jgi:hypothetical protein
VRPQAFPTRPLASVRALYPRTPHNGRSAPTCAMRQSDLRSRFDSLSTRFSFNDLLGFLEFGFFGDLSPMALLPRGEGSGVRTGFARCGAQRSHHPLVMLNAERRGVTPEVSGRHVPQTLARAERWYRRSVRPREVREGHGHRRVAMPKSGLLRCWPPIEPRKGAPPKANTPPSAATIQ